MVNFLQCQRWWKTFSSVCLLPSNECAWKSWNINVFREESSKHVICQKKGSCRFLLCLYLLMIRRKPVFVRSLCLTNAKRREQKNVNDLKPGMAWCLVNVTSSCDFSHVDFCTTAFHCFLQSLSLRELDRVVSSDPQGVYHISTLHCCWADKTAAMLVLSIKRTGLCWTQLSGFCMNPGRRFDCHTPGTL